MKLYKRLAFHQISTEAYLAKVSQSVLVHLEPLACLWGGPDETVQQASLPSGFYWAYLAEVLQCVLVHLEQLACLEGRPTKALTWPAMSAIYCFCTEAHESQKNTYRYGFNRICIRYKYRGFGWGFEAGKIQNSDPRIKTSSASNPAWRTTGKDKVIYDFF